MDPATIIGILLAFGAVYAMVNMEGASVSSLLLPAPMILVFGATLAVGLAGSTLKDTLHAFKSVPAAIKGKSANPMDTVEELVSLAEKARSEGLLSLEGEAQDSKDSFTRLALQNIADGTDGEDLRVMLEDEIHAKKVSDHTASKFFKTLGGYAPTIGIVGTVVSLTHVLENLSEPAELGHMIAAAFVATLWGLLSANFMWLPIGDRIAKISDLEQDRMNLVMEGLLAIQAGSQPLLLRERLKSMVPPHKLKEGKGGSASGKGSSKGSGKSEPKLKAAA
ncbi:motility protein A [Pseudarthrobacter sp. BIM B-2242]|uniref:motility protein A n=1 Tax=Pseudarthrobacter sp. BIM B-2242 TaxID=2772401 RepID=UPI00168AC9A3|nr:MotA/TolQ/ExbB proton channel family protein [Pseudarthrobacter sp. BIM B-2242]QOD05751.1 MotA/TolQ/ExbB proton channel family protein [Pseudarthrobacter sp. BIM B-2242]